KPFYDYSIINSSFSILSISLRLAVAGDKRKYNEKPQQLATLGWLWLGGRVGIMLRTIYGACFNRNQYHTTNEYILIQIC
ncbi:hypothetical protein ACJX0J_010907, partial [Zea mays]